ncbi:hypothetical protein [Candidatus Jordarchaeum sp.]
MSVSVFVVPCCLREFPLSLEVVALGCLWHAGVSCDLPLLVDV